MEKHGRGVVALHPGDGKVLVSWRLLGAGMDPPPRPRITTARD